MKNLSLLIRDLETQLDKYKKLEYLLTPKVCPMCKILKTKEDDLISLYHAGMCLSCDHSYGETLN